MPLADFDFSARMVEAIRKICFGAIDDIYPKPRAATVTAVDYTNRTATVQYPDEGGTFTVSISSLAPVVGGVVLIAGRPGTRTVDKVLSGGVILPNRNIGSGAPGGTGVKGDNYYDITNLRLYLSDGTGWAIMSEPTITTFASTIGNTGGAGSSAYGTVDFRYHRNDGYLDWSIIIPIVTNGPASGAVTLTLPVAATATQIIGYGREDAVTGAMLQVLGTASTTAYIYNYANAYPGGTGYTLRCSGRYQMTTRYS